MATFTNAQGNFGLIATPTPEKQNSNLSGNTGIQQQTIGFGNKPIYCIGIEFSAEGDTVTLNPLTGVLSGATELTAASLSFELASNPANNDTFTVGSTVYTFKTSATVAGQVQIGATATDTATNLQNEINGYADHPADPLVDAVSIGQDITLGALAPGAAGNEITLNKSNPTSWLGLGPNLIGGSDGVVYPSYEGDGNDCEGIDLPASDNNPAFLMTVSAGRVKATDGADFSAKIGAISTTAPGYANLGADALSFDGNITLSCVAMPETGTALATVQLLLSPS